MEKPDRPHENYMHLLKELENEDLDTRMNVVKHLLKADNLLVPGLLVIAMDCSKKVDYRKSVIYALGQMDDCLVTVLLIKIINGFQAGSAEKREITRIEEKLTEDEHLGLASEAKAALIEMGYRVEIRTLDL